MTAIKPDDPAPALLPRLLQRIAHRLGYYVVPKWYVQALFRSIRDLREELEAGRRLEEE